MIGPNEAQFFKFLMKLLNVKRVLDIGTFVGYSALTFADGLSKDGESVITCELDSEIAQIAKMNFQKYPSLQSKIDLRIGPAKETIESLNGTFDLIFLDANKKMYIEYYETILSRNLLDKRGVLLVDNTLFKGLVLPDQLKSNKIGASIHKFNEHLTKDNRTEKIILPFRDGITMVRLL